MLRAAAARRFSSKPNQVISNITKPFFLLAMWLLKTKPVHSSTPRLKKPSFYSKLPAFFEKAAALDVPGVRWDDHELFDNYASGDTPYFRAARDAFVRVHLTANVVFNCRTYSQLFDTMTLLSHFGFPNADRLNLLTYFVLALRWIERHRAHFHFFACTASDDAFSAEEMHILR